LKVTVTHQQSKEAKYSLGFVLAGATASDCHYQAGWKEKDCQSRYMH
jgi:coenzyme F420-reducing hydrogenase delta subunit